MKQRFTRLNNDFDKTPEITHSEQLSASVIPKPYNNKAELDQAILYFSNKLAKLTIVYSGILLFYFFLLFVIGAKGIFSNYFIYGSVFIPYLIWVPLIAKLPTIYYTRYNSAINLLKSITEKKRHVDTPAYEGEKAQFLESGYLLASLFYYLEKLELIGNIFGSRTKLYKVFFRYFFNTDGTTLSKTNYRNSFKNIEELKISNNNYDELKMKFINVLTPDGNVISDYEEFALSEKAVIQTYLPPQVIKGLFMQLNGKLFTEMPEPFIDSFLNEVFYFKKSNKRSHVKIDSLLRRLKDNL